LAPVTIAILVIVDSDEFLIPRRSEK